MAAEVPKMLYCNDCRALHPSASKAVFDPKNKNERVLLNAVFDALARRYCSDPNEHTQVVLLTDPAAQFKLLAKLAASLGLHTCFQQEAFELVAKMLLENGGLLKRALEQPRYATAPYLMQYMLDLGAFYGKAKIIPSPPKRDYNNMESIFAKARALLTKEGPKGCHMVFVPGVSSTMTIPKALKDNLFVPAVEAEALHDEMQRLEEHLNKNTKYLGAVFTGGVVLIVVGSYHYGYIVMKEAHNWQRHPVLYLIESWGQGEEGTPAKFRSAWMRAFGMHTREGPQLVLEQKPGFGRRYKKQCV